MKRLLFVSLLLVACGVSLVWSEERIAVPLEDSPSLGPSSAPITIVEFIDFQ